MQSYKRKITYFFQYHNGNIGSTAGFLKLEIRGDKVKVNINIQEPGDLPYKDATLYFYHEAGDHLVAVPVDHIDSRNGILTYQKRTSWQQMYDTGRDLYTFDGVAVLYNDSHYYIGDFKDKNRKDYPLVVKEPIKRENILEETFGVFEAAENVSGKQDIFRTQKQTVEKEERITESGGIKPEKSETEQNNAVSTTDDEKDEVQGKSGSIRENERQAEQSKSADIREDESETKQGRAVENREEKKEERNKDEEFFRCEDCPYLKKRMEQPELEDAFEKMINEYPKLPMYGVTELFDCVRIHPRDIGKLDMRNWKLGVNSFLTHGFYTYQYLLLGKMRFDIGEDKQIIGVPGIYSNREKYLANMFGFEQFVPVKKTGIKTGQFGYWIVEISPYI